LVIVVTARSMVVVLPAKEISIRFDALLGGELHGWLFAQPPRH
jgi:hypothetical protein